MKLTRRGLLTGAAAVALGPLERLTGVLVEAPPHFGKAGFYVTNQRLTPRAVSLVINGVRFAGFDSGRITRVGGEP